MTHDSHSIEVPRNSGWVVDPDQSWYTLRLSQTHPNRVYHRRDTQQYRRQYENQDARQRAHGRGESHTDQRRPQVTDQGKPQHARGTPSQPSAGSSQDRPRNTGQPNVNSEDSATAADEPASERTEIGQVSEEWRKAASCLALSSFTFLLAVVAFFAFSLTVSNLFLYVMAVLTLVYGALRFGFSYYIYKDAKILAYHSREQRGKPWTSPKYGWTPSPFLWAFFTFATPPFVQYAPAAVYFVRRRQRTGIP